MVACNKQKFFGSASGRTVLTENTIVLEQMLSSDNLEAN